MRLSPVQTPSRAVLGERRNAAPSIGIVHDESSIAGRIAETIESLGYPLAFVVPIGRLGENHRDKAVDVVVAGGLPGTRDREKFQQIREAFPDARIVACMEPATLRVLRWAIDAGVDGIVWDTELERTLDPTIHAVCAGQLTVPRDAYRRTGTEELTNREKQCLSLVIMGMTNREIAQKLFISESTVKSHLNSSYRKLGVHSRAEAQSLIADPSEGLGTGILAITRPGLARGLTRDPSSRE